MSRGANACRSISCSIGIRTGSSSRTIFGSDDGLDAAAHGKVSDDGHAAGRDRADEGVENLVRHGLVKDPFVAEFDQVVLQRFELDAPRVGDVGDANLAEVGQSRFWAYRRELGTLNRDLVVAFGTRVGERFERLA